MTDGSPPVRDIWTVRDLPVLQAIVDIFVATGDRSIGVTAIGRRANMGRDDVQRALCALYAQPYLQADGAMILAGGDYQYVGAPTGEALRVSGAWPSPEVLLERLVASLQQASEDEGRQPEERNKLKQAALWLGGAFSQVAIGALGGAGGNIISG